MTGRTKPEWVYHGGVQGLQPQTIHRIEYTRLHLGHTFDGAVVVLTRQSVDKVGAQLLALCRVPRGADVVRLPVC